MGSIELDQKIEQAVQAWLRRSIMEILRH